MSARIKTEGKSSKIKTGGIAKSTKSVSRVGALRYTPTRKKATPQKRSTRPKARSVTRNRNFVPEFFPPACVEDIPKQIAASKKARLRRSIGLNDASIYQISDSSDDEVFINQPVIDNIDLSDTEIDTDISVSEIINNKILTRLDKQKTEQPTSCLPSTSNANAHSYVPENEDITDFINNLLAANKDFAQESGIHDTDISASEIISQRLLTQLEQQKTEQATSCLPSTSHANAHSYVPENEDITDFINNLLAANKDFVQESGLKSLQELNEDTEKLLASSEDLINDTRYNNPDNSVVYVCTNKYPNNSQAKCKLYEPTQTASIDLTKQSDEAEKDMKRDKPSCPICLEELGQTPLASTVCGHIFCATCIDDCLKKMKKCPTCRKKLTKAMVHPLFLF